VADLGVGDWVWFRHAKAGELAEHTNVVHLVREDTVVETVASYRGLGLAAWHALVRTRVSADERGLTVVNGYRRHEYEWSQVVGVNLRRGAPWAGLDLSDGTSASMVGIQGSDGERAVRAVRELRALVDANTRTGEDDPPR
jgi:hypothetical protein